MTQQCKAFDAQDKAFLLRIGAAVADEVGTIVDAEIKISRVADAGGDLYEVQIKFGNDELDIPIRRSAVLTQFGIASDS